MATIRIRHAWYCIGTLLLALLPTGVFAQSSSDGQISDPAWAEVRAAALKEGKVVMYGDLNANIMGRLKPDFEKANPGITLESARLYGPNLISKIETEHTTGADGADVAVAVEVLNWYEGAMKQGLLKMPAGPAAKSWPADYLLQGTVPILQVESLLMAYNTNVVKTPITGFQDLLKPEFKGMIGVPEPVAIAIIAWYDWLEQTEGPDFPAKLAAQNPRIFPSSTPLTQSVISGEIAAATMVSSSTVQPFVAQGAPIKVFYPASATGFRYGGAILGWAKRPNAALVFMDYLMSRRGQTAWSGTGDSASPLTGIPGSLDIKAIHPYDLKRFTTDFEKAYVEKWKTIFHRN